MSGKTNLASHKYKLDRHIALKSQATRGQATRKAHAANAVSAKLNRDGPSHKDPGVPQIDALKRKLDVKLQKQSEFATRHNERQSTARKAIVQQVRAASAAVDEATTRSDNNPADDTTSVVKRRWYYKELKQIVDTSDILLEVRKAQQPHQQLSLLLQTS